MVFVTLFLGSATVVSVGLSPQRCGLFSRLEGKLRAPSPASAMRS
nr:MAG TPA: hypothetical protein [Caudoviricetes sp.]